MTLYRGWTEQDDAAILAGKARGETFGQIGAALGRTEASCYSRHNRLVKKGAIGQGVEDVPTIHILRSSAVIPPVDPIVAERERQQRVKLLKEERDLLKDVAGEQNFRDFLAALIEKVGHKLPPPPRYIPPKIPRKSSKETMVMLLSDWHNGEVVSGEAMRGFNAFNKDVFSERVEKVIKAHLIIKSHNEAGGAYHYERCIVGLNGDFVSGTIHELEKHGDHENVVWAVYETGRKLAWALRELSPHYPRIDIFCTSGNHGRLPDARKVQQKEPTRSWDTMVYLIAKTALEDVKNITWTIPNSYSVAWEVYGWRFLQTHGHDVKSWNSIPFYGINRMVSNINALEAGRGSPIHYWLLGHFHTMSSMPHATGEMFVNGSIIGGNEFALNGLGKVDRPQQLLLAVHPEQGISGQWRLYAAPALGAPEQARKAA